MLFFSLTLVAGVASVLGAQKLDIEGLNPSAPKRFSVKQSMAKRNAAANSDAAAAYVPGAVFLRQQ